MWSHPETLGSEWGIEVPWLCRELAGWALGSSEPLRPSLCRGVGGGKGAEAFSQKALWLPVFQVPPRTRGPTSSAVWTTQAARSSPSSPSRSSASASPHSCHPAPLSQGVQFTASMARGPCSNSWPPHCDFPGFLLKVSGPEMGQVGPAVSWPLASPPLPNVHATPARGPLTSQLPVPVGTAGCSQLIPASP